MNWRSKIDKIFILNLPERTERREYIISEMKKYGITDFNMIPATFNENGELGIKLTMESVFSYAVENDFENLLVFEDDGSIIAADFEERMNSVIKELPEDYLTLQLGINMLMPPTRHSAHLLKVKAGYEAHAVLYSKEAIKMILSLLHDSLPYDVILAKHIQPLGRSYCTIPMLVTQKPFPSDIAKFENYAKNPAVAKYLDFENKMILWNVMMNERFNQYTKDI